MNRLNIRLLEPRDFAFADSIRALAGWNQTPADWQRFLNGEPEGCFLAEWDGCPAGTATTIYYGPGLAWIGMMLVHPDRRRCGIGLALLQYSIRYLEQRGARCVKLDATPLGQPLYERMGFQPCGSLTRWETVGLPPAEVPAFGSAPLNETDFDDVVALDEKAFGYSRRRVLQELVPRSCVAVVCRTGKPDAFGFGMLREGSRAHYLGPVAAETPETATLLVQYLLGQVPHRPVYWDVPVTNKVAMELATSLGLKPQRHLLRMSRGESCVVGDANLQFGIADPAVG